MSKRRIKRFVLHVYCCRGEKIYGEVLFSKSLPGSSGSRNKQFLEKLEIKGEKSWIANALAKAKSILVKRKVSLYTNGSPPGPS
jgi:hypothetical protein